MPLVIHRLATVVSCMIPRCLTIAAEWMLVIAVIFAPWGYGATRPETVLCLNIICYGAGLFWLLGRLLSFTAPQSPWPLVLCAGLILMQGWWMTWNAQSIYDRYFGQFASLQAPWPAAPGSIDQTLSFDFMFTLTSLLFACLAAADLGRRRSFRQIILAAMILTGTSLSLFGFWILLSGSDILWWPYGKSPFMFATFRYHANAGAFLNLVWPISLAATLLAFLKGRNPWMRSVYLLCSMILGIAVVVNASKGAQGVAVLMVLGLSIFLIFLREKIFPNLSKKILGVTLVSFFCIFLAFAFFIGTDHAETRWKILWNQEGDSLRSRVYQIELQMPKDAGLLGSGPATFQARFPFYNEVSPKKVEGYFWNYAHQDYIQTVVEWGYLGALFWTLLSLIGGLRLFFSMRAQWAAGRLEDPLMALAVLFSLGGIFLHALVDFPLQVPSLQLYTLLLLGFAWSSPEWSSRSPTGFR